MKLQEDDEDDDDGDDDENNNNSNDSNNNNNNDLVAPSSVPHSFSRSPKSQPEAILTLAAETRFLVLYSRISTVFSAHHSPYDSLVSTRYHLGTT